jgi:AcrR family transcriptional regulator
MLVRLPRSKKGLYGVKKTKSSAPYPRRGRSRAAAKKRPRQRLSPELRHAQILDAAAKLVVKQGFLPISVEQLAELAGSSKALIYTYFPTQFEIFNALLKRELDSLAQAGLDTASKVDDFEQAAQLCAMLYFEHVVRAGPLLHILLTDLFMSGHIDPEATRAGKVMLARLVRSARRSLKLKTNEVMAAAEMIAAIPEEAGSLAYHRELGAAVARELCHTLMLSSLEALRSGRLPVSRDNAA